MENVSTRPSSTWDSSRARRVSKTENTFDKSKMLPFITSVRVIHKSPDRRSSVKEKFLKFHTICQVKFQPWVHFQLHCIDQRDLESNWLAAKDHPISIRRREKDEEEGIQADMSRNISYITGTQLLSFKRRPNVAIIDVRYILRPKFLFRLT